MKNNEMMKIDLKNGLNSFVIHHHQKEELIQIQKRNIEIKYLLDKMKGNLYILIS